MRGPYNDALGPVFRHGLKNASFLGTFYMSKFPTVHRKRPSNKNRPGLLWKTQTITKKKKRNCIMIHLPKLHAFSQVLSLFIAPPKRKGQNFTQRIAAPKKSCFQLQSFQSGSAQLLVAVDMDCASMLLSESLPRVDKTLHVSSC